MNDSRLRHLVLLATLALALGLAVLPAGCGGGESDGGEAAVAARVNGQEVLESAVAGVRAEVRLVGGDDDRAAALETAIDNELVRQEAARLGVSADPDTVEERLEYAAENLGGDEALSAALEAASMSAIQFRESLRLGALREAVQDARFADVKVSAAAVRRYYRQNRDEQFIQAEAVHLKAIVVRNEGIARNALKRVRQGQEFGNASRQFSIDPELKANEGDMGWIASSSLPAKLRKCIRDLRAGQISEPTAGPGGWYVLKVIGRRDAKVFSLAVVRGELTKELTRHRRAAALEEWLKEAREDARIEKL